MTAEAASAGWVTLADRAQPNPAARAQYDRLYGIYKDLYPALKDAMHQLRVTGR